MSVLRPVALDTVPADLLAAARAARARAYVPYSGFAVGAAVRDDGGRVHAGPNVENASFGATRCAEQAAVLALVAAGGRVLTQVVVVADADPPATPCGICRQVLAEFGPTAAVFLVSERGAWHTSVDALLPAAFALRR